MLAERAGFAIPSRLNVLVIAMQLCAMAGLFLAAREAHGWLWFLALAAGAGVVLNSIYSTIHEAEHGMLFSHRRLNDLAGVLLALLFPAPFHLIRQGHLGHHLRNRSDDEAFDLIVPGESAAWKRLQFFGIVTGFYWATVALSNVVVLVAPSILGSRGLRFDRATAAFMDSLNSRYTWAIRVEALAAVVLHVSIVWGCGIPVLHYLVLYAGFGWSWSAMQYVHHFGTERHVTRGARNLWIWGPLDLLWLNHNWHLTHHTHPTVPWRHLPRLAAQAPAPLGTAPENGPSPANEASERSFLPAAYLRMWRGPRRTEDRVENRYAGRIIR